jgi:hypothetical protein
MVVVVVVVFDFELPLAPADPVAGMVGEGVTARSGSVEEGLIGAEPCDP